MDKNKKERWLAILICLGIFLIIGFYVVSLWRHNEPVYVPETKAARNWIEKEVYLDKSTSVESEERDERYYYSIDIPESWSDLIIEHKLKNNVSINTIWYYDYNDVTIDPNEERLYNYNEIEFPNAKSQTILNTIFEFESINEKNENEFGKHKPLMNIVINASKLGYGKLNIILYDEGYIKCNIIRHEEYYYVGEENIQNVIDYVLNNYQGYKYVYIEDQNNNESYSSNR